MEHRPGRRTGGGRRNKCRGHVRYGSEDGHVRCGSEAVSTITQTVSGIANTVNNGAWLRLSRSWTSWSGITREYTSGQAAGSAGGVGGSGTTGPGETTGGGPGGVVQANSGTGGIRDFGPGTPARLHGREAVMTEAAILKAIEAAARGGQGDDDRPIIIEVGGEEVARYMLSELRSGAQGYRY